MSSADIQQNVFEEAADWLMKMQEGPLDDEERVRFRKWVACSQEHRLVWQKVEKFTGKMDSLPASLAVAALDRPDNPQRRLAISKLAVLIAAVPTGWGTWKYTQSSLRAADYQTGIGEQKTCSLTDGSIITLNTDSAISVQLDAQQRLITLCRGEIHIETSHQPDPRPFIVVTAEGRLQALGTEFTVRQFPEMSRLAVLDGAVAVTLDNQNNRAEAKLVQVGQQVEFNATSIKPLQTVSVLDITWTTGMLMADAMLLKQLVDELGRYRQGHLRLDPAITELAISGSFPLTNTDQALNMLAATYPLKVNRVLFGYWTTLSAN